VTKNFPARLKMQSKTWTTLSGKPASPNRFTSCLMRLKHFLTEKYLDAERHSCILQL
jgi:hypothetical protein